MGFILSSFQTVSKNENKNSYYTRRIKYGDSKLNICKYLKKKKSFQPLPIKIIYVNSLLLLKIWSMHSDDSIVYFEMHLVREMRNQMEVIFLKVI